MAVLNPDHLLEQADRLIARPPHGPPRQVDLRRAISSSYYALFHLILTETADEFVGAVHQSAGRYRLVYRSIDHKTIDTICASVLKTPLPHKYASTFAKSALPSEITRFASAVRELQRRRHQADYDPDPRLKTDDAVIAIRSAREAIRFFRAISPTDRKAFLTLLVCPPR